jgi:hypothetical protein
MSGPRRLTHLLGGVTPQRDWLTMAQLAEHGKFMTRDGGSFSPEAARKFVTRHPELPRGRRGRQLVVDRAVYDRFIMSAAVAS